MRIPSGTEGHPRLVWKREMVVGEERVRSCTEMTDWQKDFWLLLLPFAHKSWDTLCFFSWLHKSSTRVQTTDASTCWVISGLRKTCLVWDVEKKKTGGRCSTPHSSGSKPPKLENYTYKDNPSRTATSSGSDSPVWAHVLTLRDCWNRFLVPSQNSCCSGSRVRPLICLSHKFPGNTDADGFWEPLPKGLNVASWLEESPRVSAKRRLFWTPSLPLNSWAPAV